MIYSGHMPYCEQNRTMKWGLAALIPLLVFTGFGCSKKTVETSQTDCQKAQYPFACVLDKAMAAKDPSLCIEAGNDRIMTCISGYEEVTGIKINCAELKNPAVAAACVQAHKTK